VKRLICRIYAKKMGGHVHASVFADMMDDSLAGKSVSLAHAGELVFREEEWPEFLKLLRHDPAVPPPKFGVGVVPFGAASPSLAVFYQEGLPW
jgi:hypothetical protein